MHCKDPLELDDLKNEDDNVPMLDEFELVNNCNVANN
jgi:hypothetical protein